jgi:hypothetical protein
MMKYILSHCPNVHTIEFDDPWAISPHQYEIVQAVLELLRSEEYYNKSSLRSVIIGKETFIANEVEMLGAILLNPCITTIVMPLDNNHSNQDEFTRIGALYPHVRITTVGPGRLAEDVH